MPQGFFAPQAVRQVWKNKEILLPCYIKVRCNQIYPTPKNNNFFIEVTPKHNGNHTRSHAALTQGPPTTLPPRLLMRGHRRIGKGHPHPQGECHEQEPTYTMLYQGLTFWLSREGKKGRVPKIGKCEEKNPFIPFLFFFTTRDFHSQLLWQLHNVVKNQDICVCALRTRRLVLE